MREHVYTYLKKLHLLTVTFSINWSSILYVNFACYYKISIIQYILINVMLIEHINLLNIIMLSQIYCCQNFQFLAVLFLNSNIHLIYWQKVVNKDSEVIVKNWRVWQTCRYVHSFFFKFLPIRKIYINFL